MYRVIGCFTEQHDYRLVLLAVLVCSLDTIATFQIYGYARATGGIRRMGWLILTGVVSGWGVWATHFVAMLAFNPGISTSYDPALTLLSLVISVLAASIGFTIAAGHGRPHPAIGGSILGLGIGFMHFTGMEAMHFPGTFDWHYGLVAASVLIGMAFASAGLLAAHRLGGWRGTSAAAGLLVLAICGLHFTAMGALALVPDPTVAPTLFNHMRMGIVVASAAMLVLLAGLAIALVDSLSQRESNTLLRGREKQLEEQNARFDAALANMLQGLAMFDKDQRLIVCNDRYPRMYGLDPHQLKPGTTIREILQMRSMSGDAVATEIYITEHLAELGAASSWSRIHTLNDGRTFSVVYCPREDGGFVITLEDITAQRLAEARIAHLAHHDALTDLPNRVLLRDRLADALVRVRHGDTLAVHCIDLDCFKEANDELGHPVGDALLKAVAGRLRACVGESDTVARIGGDSFAVVQIPTRSPAEAGALAAHINETLCQPFVVDGHHIVVGASIGIAMAPGDSADPGELVKDAELALDRAKAENKGSYRFFEPEMNARMQARRDLERDLKNALVNGEFEVHYQPVMNLQREEVSGVEALVRWRHPERGFVSPVAFIPLAEETSLIVAIGEWVMRQAIAQAAAWSDHLTVAVNVSPVQFSSRNLIPMIADALATSGLAPNRLEIEITESVLLGDTDHTRATLLELRALGVRIALDDFGTGYSSLSYLRSFPFDKIKIDRCFVKDLSESDPHALAIVRAVVMLGVTLGMVTTAEGVETKEQYDIVRAEGCTEIQGYLLSPPKAAKDIAHLLGCCARSQAA